MTDIGEYFVGAYLEQFLSCEIVVYNITDNNFNTQNEIDVIGISMKNNTAYLCEVKTHIKGFNTTSRTNRVNLINGQFAAMDLYAKRNLSNIAKCEIMFWALKVTNKQLLQALNNNYAPANIIINTDYTKAMKILANHAATSTNEFKNPFLRALQIGKFAQAI